MFAWRGPRKGDRFFITLFLTLILSCRKKLTQKLAETEEALSSASQKASNAEKAKNRLNSELEDALIDLEKVSWIMTREVPGAAIDFFSIK